VSFHTGSRWKILHEKTLKDIDNTETKHNPEKANNVKQQNKTTSLLTRLFQETRWAYSTMLLSPHGAERMIKLMVMSISLAVTLT